MALSVTDIADVRRFAGYPVVGAFAHQGLEIQGNSTTIDLLVTGLSDTEASLVQTMLTNLRLLEADIPGMRDGLDTNKAAVWERNPAEMVERETLFLAMRRRLCAFLGVPPGPGLYVEMVTAGGSAAPPAIFIV